VPAAEASIHQPTDRFVAGGAAMRLLVPDGARRRGLPCDVATTTVPPASPAPALAGSGRTVVVGIRRDAASRELLTWALVKVANAGDRVVALHVAADGASLSVLTKKETVVVDC
jgi:hypothetical protein